MRAANETFYRPEPRVTFAARQQHSATLAGWAAMAVWALLLVLDATGWLR